jgi:Flp pilus assembly protein TadG
MSLHHPVPNRSRLRRRGQALVELAIILPVLALIFLAIVQFSFIFAAQVGVTNAVREAARIAAVSTTTTDAQAATSAPDVYNRLTSNTNGLLKRNVFGFNASNIVTSGVADTQVCYRDGPAAAAGEYVVFVKVEAGYRHPVLVPILGAILDGIDGVSDGGLRVATAEEMRVENQVLLASPAVSECYNP